MVAGGLTRGGLTEALRRLWQPVLFVLFAGMTFWWFFTIHDFTGLVGSDFRGTLWDAARTLAGGESPYPDPSSLDLASGSPALYPPFAIAATIPLSWLPWSVAIGIWSLILVAGTLGGTWLLGVRDWRCYCVVLASLPLLFGVLCGNLTPLLLLGVGAAWRYRTRSLLCGLALGVIIAAKLFLWPLVVWALLTRRFRAAAWATVVALVLVLVPWSLIGFEGLREYPDLLQAAADLYGPHSHSLVAAGGVVGLSDAAAQALPPLAAVLLLAVAAIASRREDGGRRAFALATLAALAGSPILWTHYLVLLVAPIALIRPRLSWLWLALPATLVVDHLPGGGLTSALSSAPPFGQALGVAALVVALSGLVLVLPLDRSGAR